MFLGRDSSMNATAALTLGLALALVGLGLGLPLAWAGMRGLQQYPAEEWRMPSWGWLLVAALFSLVFGQAALSAGLDFVAPIFHILAGALPPLMFVSLTTHRGADLPSRQRIGALSWGALGSTGLAIAIEMALVIAALIAAAVWIGATNPQLLESLQEMTLRYAGRRRDPGGAWPNRRYVPVTACGRDGAGRGRRGDPVHRGRREGAGLAAGACRRRDGLPARQAFLLGVVSGAGFALLEGILNGVMALMNPATWGGLMLVRGGTAAVHCVATGFVALGWYAILVEKRWARGIAFGLLGVAIHGAWNLAAGGQALIAFFSQGQGAASVGMQGLLMGLTITLMAGIWVAAVAVLVGARRAQPVLPIAAIPDGDSHCSGSLSPRVLSQSGNDLSSKEDGLVRGFKPALTGY